MKKKFKTMKRNLMNNFNNKKNFIKSKIKNIKLKF
jgi:hypothetical protein